jgi:CRISPR-associated protein Cas5d
MYRFPALTVKVWGEWACFTRPEMKVERVSYPVPTASAARGILEAIFWKPQFAWQVQAVQVLRPIQYASLLRNEVKSKAAASTVQRWPQQDGHFYIDEDRTQRHTLALRDVAYVIEAQVQVAAGVDDDPAKFRDQFRRRVQRGQCYTRPYLGCREFAAAFAPPGGGEEPIDVSRPLGRMLLDLDYEGQGGRGEPRFFEAALDRGVVRYPERRV